MKLRTVIAIGSATAASLLGVVSFAASPASAAAAQTMPAADLTGFLGIPVPVFASPFSEAGTFPNVKVTGNCSDAPWLFSDILGLDFQSGNAVVYRGPSGPVFPFLPDGLNAVGVAVLDASSTGPHGFGPTEFVGPAHVWLGQGANAKGQIYAGETVSFTGTASDGSGSTISFTANPGFVVSAGGHQGGWGQQNLTCNIL